MSKPVDELAAELETLEDVQQRIDRVAEDFATGEDEYCVIDAWQLGELLGLDFHDTAEWNRSFWAYRREPEDDIDIDFPFAENVDLLQKEISASRYQQLAALAKEIITKREGDLPLTKDEEVLLRDAYARTQADGFPDLAFASTTLISSSGAELEFEVCIGDAGDPEDPHSPYDLRNGKGFDFSNYIQLE
jgi:hypothetical protein